MSDKEKTAAEKRNRIQQNILGSEGISDVEKRRQKLEEKKSYKAELDPETLDKIQEEIKEGLTIKIDYKDILLFLLAQFLPLLVLGSSFFIPGLVIILDSNNDDLRNFLIILIVLGSLVYLYGIIRLVCMLTYKIEINSNELKWRNIFWWNTISNNDLEEINAINSYYLYLTKIGGFLRFGIEIFQIKSKDKDFWVRAYPFRKKKIDELLKKLNCWIEIDASNN